jgi:hypothetical protein
MARLAQSGQSRKIELYSASQRAVDGIQKVGLKAVPRAVARDKNRFLDSIATVWQTVALDKVRFSTAISDRGGWGRSQACRRP